MSDAQMVPNSQGVRDSHADGLPFTPQPESSSRTSTATFVRAQTYAPMPHRRKTSDG